jgi:hypothetical protein
VISTQLAAIASHPSSLARLMRTRLDITQCWLDAYRTPRITPKTKTDHEKLKLMTTSYYLPTDDADKADFLDPLFSFRPALRGEKKIQTTATVLSSSLSTPSRTPPTPLRYPPPAPARYGTTKPSTASTMNKWGSGAMW